MTDPTPEEIEACMDEARKLIAYKTHKAGSLKMCVTVDTKAVATALARRDAVKRGLERQLATEVEISTRVRCERDKERECADRLLRQLNEALEAHAEALDD